MDGPSERIEVAPISRTCLACMRPLKAELVFRCSTVGNFIYFCTNWWLFIQKFFLLSASIWKTLIRKNTHSSPLFFLRLFLRLFSFNLLTHFFWRSVNFESKLSSSEFFQKTNEWIQLYYYATCFCSFLGRNWRHQKDITKSPDL